MGTGKTTIGRRLASRTGKPFADTDAIVVERAGLSIAEIFRLHGESAFRDLESEVLASLDPTEPRILSTGGGIVLRPENRERLRALGLVVWLRASPAEILARISRNTQRPLMQTPDPAATIRELLTTREPLYRESAHWTLETTGLPIPETVHRILVRSRDR